jgi:plasmid maintenance system antidote protein VapI
MKTAMRMDYTALKVRIKDKFGTQSKCAEALGVSQESLSRSLNKAEMMSAPTQEKLIKLLDLSPEEVMDCFYKRNESV